MFTIYISCLSVSFWSKLRKPSKTVRPFSNNCVEKMQSGHKRWCVLRVLFVKTSVFSPHKRALYTFVVVMSFSLYRNPNRRSLYSVCLAAGYNGDSPLLRAEVIKKLSREISRGGLQKIEKKFAPAALEKWAATRGLEAEPREMVERGRNGPNAFANTRRALGKECSGPFFYSLK